MTGKRFKQIRRKLGLSQSQLAKLLGVWPNTVVHWDRGDKPIPGPIELCLKLLLEKHERGETDGKKSRTKGIYKKLGKAGAVTYAVRYYVPDESSPKGWRQQQKTFTKEAGAIEFKREMTNKVKDDDYVAPGQFDGSEIGEKFLQSKGHLKPQTRISYQLAFMNYINPRFYSMKATSLRAYEIDAAAAEWNERISAVVVNWVINRLSNPYHFAKKSASN